ncbi:hypothetical protein VP1G_02002 [Cytospora mali]|uniref:Uncharacterized protein n=1 Tax=Cytospora mali TaxID=578113 RepID=A0A194USD5_CYTMA|nr:hypothetical protein VP1G_02002 [Valsa mali var. pyri (nom. inval.)]
MPASLMANTTSSMDSHVSMILPFRVSEDKDVRSEYAAHLGDGRSVVLIQRNSSWLVAPFRNPPPGESGEAMFRIATFLVVLAGEVRRKWAAVRVSHARIVRRGGDAMASPLPFEEGRGWALGAITSSAASMPRRARGCADRSEGMTLLMVALAFFARASRLKAGGGRPMEGSVLPMTASLVSVKLFGMG